MRLGSVKFIFIDRASVKNYFFLRLGSVEIIFISRASVKNNVYCGWGQ